MRVRTRLQILLLLVIVPTISFGAAAHAAYNYNDHDRQLRWEELRKQIFGARTIQADDRAVHLDAPDTAVDAALVPLTVTLAEPKRVKSLYLVIDDNPSPLAAHFTFGPAADPEAIKLRVRVNHVTNIHAVAETSDGRLLETAHLVRASGGCSAPMGMSEDEAMRGIGQMKLNVAGEISAGKSAEATLMVRHPNFNGMQMNEMAQVFTPARYIQKIDVTFGGQRVFALDTDISLATNPVLTFDFVPGAAKGELKVDIEDSKASRWSKTFAVPNVNN